MAVGLVLPASAGMILSEVSFSVSSNGAPRIRGDDPSFMASSRIRPTCSPHPRG